MFTWYEPWARNSEDMEQENCVEDSLGTFTLTPHVAYPYFDLLSKLHFTMMTAGSIQVTR